MLNDAHCHFFSAQFLDPRQPARARRHGRGVVPRDRMGRARRARGARRSLGHGARCPRREPRGADRQRARRRAVGDARRRALPRAPGRLLHGERRRRRRGRADPRRASRGTAHRVPVSGHAPRAPRRCAHAGGGARGRGQRRRGVRSLWGADGRRPRRSLGCPAPSTCASAIRWRPRAWRRSFRPRRSSCRTSGPGVPRGADGGRHLRQPSTSTHPARTAGCVTIPG